MLAMLLLLIDSEEDQRKFEELYHRYKQLMFHVSRDYFHTESAVEDAVQEAFIRIIKNFSKIGEINCPQTKHFIVIVVRSTCIDLLRTGKGEGVAIPCLLYTSLCWTIFRRTFYSLWTSPMSRCHRCALCMQGIGRASNR